MRDVREDYACIHRMEACANFAGTLVISSVGVGNQTDRQFSALEALCDAIDDMIKADAEAMAGGKE